MNLETHNIRSDPKWKRRRRLGFDLALIFQLQYYQQNG